MTHQDRAHPPRAGSSNLLAIEILVVCTGNTCRSPLVAGWLTMLLGDQFRVSSAGLLGWSERPATDHTITVAERVGVPLRDHRSRKVDVGDIEAAALILAMTRGHAWGVAAHDPEAASRTFLLPEVVRQGQIVGWRGERSLDDWVGEVGAGRDSQRPGRPTDEVADPAGQPLEIYEELAVRLGPLVHSLAELLDRGPADASPDSEVR